MPQNVEGRKLTLGQKTRWSRVTWARPKERIRRDRIGLFPEEKVFRAQCFFRNVESVRKVSKLFIIWSGFIGRCVWIRLLNQKFLVVCFM